MSGTSSTPAGGPDERVAKLVLEKRLAGGADDQGVEVTVTCEEARGQPISLPKASATDGH
jgi:hypothetical protein